MCTYAAEQGLAVGQAHLVPALLEAVDGPFVSRCITIPQDNLPVCECQADPPGCAPPGTCAALCRSATTAAQHGCTHLLGWMISSMMLYCRASWGRMYSGRCMSCACTHSGCCMSRGLDGRSERFMLCVHVQHHLRARRACSDPHPRHSGWMERCNTQIMQQQRSNCAMLAASSS